MTKSLTELFTLDELINKLTESNINLGEEIKGHTVTSQDLKNFKKELRTYGISCKKLNESMSVYNVKDGEQTLQQKIKNLYSNKNTARPEGYIDDFEKAFEIIEEKHKKLEEIKKEYIKFFKRTENLTVPLEETKLDNEIIKKIEGVYARIVEDWATGFAKRYAAPLKNKLNNVVKTYDSIIKVSSQSLKKINDIENKQ